ncbi:MAG: peptidylprolyl isomerase, partial [Acidobacteriota bacterium]|nr:peptidylprolyl isomerase [Acidobacteriota bacterium]
LEALGKIAAALPKSDEARRQSIGEAIVLALNTEQKSTKPNREMVLYGLTAILRARPADAGRAAVTPFLDVDDARVRADAANTLARLRAKDVNAERLRARLTGDADAVVRANFARVLGAAEDKASFDGLLDRAVNDPDERVRVSAIRALASLQDARAATVLMKRADTLFSAYRAARAKGLAHPAEANELLEVATALGRTIPNTGDERALTFLRNLSEAEERGAPEIEIALARIAPARYLREPMPSNASPARGATQAKWQTVSAVAQGLGEMASMTSAPNDTNAASIQREAQKMLRGLADDNAGTPALAMPDVLRALAAFKPDDLGDVLRAKLGAPDVIARATAAELLAELSPAPATTRALADALPRALKDEMNDAALAILVALAKQNHAEAFNAIKTALVVPDHLVRRRAAALLKGNGQQQGVGSSAAVTGEHFMAAKNPRTVYARALARVGKSIRATVTTDKGAFIIELLPEDAPLTVDNFVELARRRFFDGITFHRVVPNFVIQGGDPRGDGNGGPGHQIRCEINRVPYARGAVGMALSGKDTGGSQWFVTHSPQPHLDGGYTVFGRVVVGMETVDRIARGDRIRTVRINEDGRPSSDNRRTATRGANTLRR